jgi:hypothetical protein
MVAISRDVGQCWHIERGTRLHLSQRMFQQVLAPQLQQSLALLQAPLS